MNIMIQLPMKKSILSNQELMATFKVSNSGGMRRSLKTNSLVLIHNLHASTSDSIYHDEWKIENGKRILHYTGMGQSGDQSLDFAQNKTLAESKNNNIDAYLFTNHGPNQYKYEGMVELYSTPYIGQQKDKQGNMRNVYIFPLVLIESE